MATQLNPAGERFAASLINQGKVNKSAPWSWSASDEDSILGKDEDWTAYGQHFLATESGTDPKTKQHYKYPFAKGDTLYRSALTAIRQRAGQQNATPVFDAAGRLLAKVDQGEKKAAADASVTLQFAASFVAPTITDQPTGVHGICYSGGVIPDYNGLGDCIIDLANVQLSPSVFLLVNHDPDQRAGRAVIGVDQNSLSVTGLFSTVTETGKLVSAEFKEARDSEIPTPWQFSVNIKAEMESNRDKVARTVNGRNVAVNTIFSNPRVLEVSLVPAGADPNTSAAAFSAVIEATMPTTATDISVDTTELDRLRAENKALSEKLTTLQAQLTAARAQEVNNLFADLGVTPTPEEVQQFIDLSGEVFSVVATRLRENAKPTAPAHLFGVQTAGKDGTANGAVKMPSPNEIYEKRRQAAAKARGVA
jgi:hypothetical protein